MNPTPTTRPRHALRWVLGVGLVFVVVVAMALQVARQRADDQFESFLEDYNSACALHTRRAQEARDAQDTPGFSSGDYYVGPGWHAPDSQLRGGTLFRSWREVSWGSLFTVSIRQERSFFGSSIEVQMAPDIFELQLENVIFYRAICADLGVELVVEP